MRIFGSVPAAYIDRPFQGALGAALYVGSGNPDPGKESIVFRNNRMPDGAGQLLSLGTVVLGGSKIAKTALVAQVKSPTAQIPYTLPAELANKTVWFQVRTHLEDVENESIYRPRKLNLDGSLEPVNEILGTGRLLSVEKRDAGGGLFRFVYEASRDGIPPSQFVIAKATGPGTVANVTTPFVTGTREYSIEVSGLQDAAAYTFDLSAQNGAVTAALVSAIPCTADASGPPTPSGLTAVEY